MNRDKHEMALWREAYQSSHFIARDGREAEADAAVEAFRKRYPPKPQAPEAVWYDEPPFDESSDDMFPVWIEDYPYPILVAHFRDGWAHQVPGCENRWSPLNGRRVCPIAKPPEPTP